MDQYLTPNDVAERLQVHVETVLRWARAGELPGAKLGQQWRFRPGDVENFVTRRMASTPEALAIPL